VPPTTVLLLPEQYFLEWRTVHTQQPRLAPQIDRSAQSSPLMPVIRLAYESNVRVAGLVVTDAGQEALVLPGPLRHAALDLGQGEDSRFV
jgi:hypothetical protein